MRKLFTLLALLCALNLLAQQKANYQLAARFSPKKLEKLIPGSELHFIDHCCHAPMMEQPDEFNRILSTWLENNPIAS